MAAQPEGLDVRGIKVRFPFDPYDCQRVYMEKVMECLSESKNGILESPTGTGKTLCLLCAALAWRENYLTELREKHGVTLSQVEPNLDTTTTWNSQTCQPNSGSTAQLRFHVPKIIYASRTHSQLSQVMHELKNTFYRPKVAVIGSRDQLCIHPDVVKLEGNSDKVQMCRSKVHHRTCQYYNNFDGKKDQGQDLVSSGIHDIEDLSKLGSRERMCPYYMSREMKKTSDIIFMPYNYILDVKNRRAHGVDLQGAIVIIDEAHNIEKVCEESASFDLTSLDLSNCLQDIDRLIKIKKGETDEYIQDKDEEELNLQDLEDMINLKKFFLSFEEQLDSVCSQLKGTEEKYEGRFMYELFERCGVTHETADVCMGQCEKALSLLNIVAGTKRFHSGSHLQKFLDCLKIVFARSTDSSSSDVHHQLQCKAANYKVYVKTEPKKKKQTDLWTVSAKESSKKDTITLSYWCFSPGHSMKEVIDQGVRCVILTSGTLSPIDSFSSELRVDFPVILQNPHVITSDHIWISVVTRGPDQTPLNSSYAHRSEEKYQSSLGNALVNFARIVPNGMLVFFPSYFLMNDCISNWENNGIMDRLRGIKDVYTEPRRKDEFQITMDSFYAKVGDLTGSGAVFMAVCRGKVSEGLDFADNNGRAVVITGLPYPPRMDPKVTLKMEYLRGSRDSKSLHPEEWYKQQASRAVNQAVGRVIRHRNDFGAILLCDERFNYRDNHEQLPKWLKPHMKVHTTFGMAQRDLNEFFKNAKEKFGCCSRQPKEDIAKLEAELAGGDTGHISYKPKGKKLPSAPIEPKPAQCVEVHVPSMAKYSIGPSPKIRLEFEEERSPLGFFEALLQSQSTEAANTVTRYPGVCGRGALQTISSASHSDISQIAPGKRPLEVCVADGPTQPSSRESSCPPPMKKPVPNKISNTNTHELDAKAFEAELRRKLSSEGLKSFTSLVAVYKKNKDFTALRKGLEGLFGNPSLHNLLRGFLKYIRKEHKDAFNEFCYEFTGKSPAGLTQLGGSSVTIAPVDTKASVGLTAVKRHFSTSNSKKLKEKMPVSSELMGGTNKVKFSEQFTMATSSGLLPSSGLQTNNLSTSNLDSTSLLNGGKELLGSEQSVARPSLKSRVSGKICIFCGVKAVGPHEAKCGHSGCYSCWLKGMKSGRTKCIKCESDVKKKDLKRLYLV